MSMVPTSDLIFVIVILLSALIGLARGFGREVLSLVIWGGALVASLAFGNLIGMRLLAQVGEPLRGLLGFAGVFVAVLVVGAAIQWLLAALIQTTGLGGADRFLGFLFGGARGVVVCAVALILLRPYFQDSSWWRDSVIRPRLAKVEESVLVIVGQTRNLIAEPAAPSAPGTAHEDKPIREESI